MGKSLLDKLVEVRHDYQTAFLCVLNDGSTMTDEVYSARRIKDNDGQKQFEEIERTLCDAARSYARHSDFNFIKMHLLVGLIFDKDDVDNKDKIATPVDGIVRYYTGSVQSFLNGKQTNQLDFYEYGCNSQGYAKFDDLVKAIHSSGMEYVGPETFDELRTLILSGKKFEVSISGDLTKSKDEDKGIQKVITQ